MEKTTKYSVIKLIKVKKPFSEKFIIKKVQVYPYKMNKLGNAKACARMVSASNDYTHLHNKLVNVIVQDSLHNIVFEIGRAHV